MMLLLTTAVYFLFLTSLGSSSTSPFQFQTLFRKYLPVAARHTRTRTSCRHQCQYGSTYQSCLPPQLSATTKEDITDHHDNDAQENDDGEQHRDENNIDDGLASPISVHALNASHDMDHDPTITTDNDESQSNLPAKKKNSKALVVPGIALATLISCAVAAKIGLLPGAPLPAETGGFGPYTDAMIVQDTGSAVLTGSLGYIFVKANTWLAENDYLEPRDSRKIIHTLSAPLFIALWPIFSDANGARYFAASVSLVNAIRLFIAGSGGDKALAFAVSR